MKKMFIFSIVIFVSVLFSACPKEDENCNNTITFINTGDLSFYFSVQVDTIGHNHYNPSAMVANAFSWKVEPHESKKDRHKSCIEYMFTEGVSFTDGSFGLLDSLRIFIFDAQELEKNLTFKTWKRYDLSLEDLKRMNWTIAYPPKP